MDWILRLQKKPLHVKSHTALLGAGICTSIIALIWMTTLPARLATVVSVVPPHKDSALTLDALSPYAETVSQKDVVPRTEKPMTEEEIRMRVGGLIDSVKNKQTISTPVDSERAPVMTDVATSTKKDESDSNLNIGKPVLIEIRSSSGQ